MNEKYMTEANDVLRSTPLIRCSWEPKTSTKQSKN